MRKWLVLGICVCGLLLAGSARADTIIVTTSVDVVDQPSFTFGDWIFEKVTPTRHAFNLIDSVDGDYVVSNSCLTCAGDVTLRRLDNAPFSLLSLVYAGVGQTIVGGVTLTGPGNVAYTHVFQTFTFSGQPGVSSVTSVLFSPQELTDHSLIQVHAFEVQAVAVPDPASSLLLFGLGVTGLAAWRKRRG